MDRISFAFVTIGIILITAAGIPWSIPSVYGQEITITTSAEKHDNKFFGEGILQVLVTDQDADNDNVVNQISVEIEAIPQSGSTGSESILVPETGNGTGKFEFYLAHQDAAAVGPADLDADNSAGVENDGVCVTNCAPFVTFGPAGDLDIESTLYEDTRFNIRVDDLEITINYEQTSGVLVLDRNAYGSNSFVYVSVADQDANLNPSKRDAFTVDPNTEPNSDLLELNGASFVDAVIFEETGDNTAVFEGRYQLGDSIDADTESLLLVLHEKANYNASLDSPENDSNQIVELSFTIGNTSGTIDVGENQNLVTNDPVLTSDKDLYAGGDTVHISIIDQDANLNSGMIDTVQLVAFSTDTEIELTGEETGPDTGVFEADFMLASETNSTVGVIAATNFVIIRYTDERPADYSESIAAGENPEKDFAIEIEVQVIVKTGIEATSVSKPDVKDAIGGNAGPFTVASSLMLSTTVSNNNNVLQQPFVALIEVRDSSNATVYLTWQSGILEPKDSTNIGVSWMPKLGGTYLIRTFTLSSIGTEEEAVILSPVASSEIAVR